MKSPLSLISERILIASQHAKTVTGVTKSTKFDFEAGKLSAVVGKILQLIVKIITIELVNEKFNIT